MRQQLHDFEHKLNGPAIASRIRFVIRMIILESFLRCGKDLHNGLTSITHAKSETRFFSKMLVDDDRGWIAPHQTLKLQKWHNDDI